MNKIQKGISTTGKQLNRFSLDEVMDKIEEVRGVDFGPAPTGIERLIFPEARERAKKIEEMKTSSIRARKELIDGLIGCINAYVDTHKADLKVRGSAFVSETFIRLEGSLYAINEEIITSFYNTFAKAAGEYEQIPYLTDEMREELIKKVYERANQRAEMSQTAFNTILDNIAEQVKKLSREIGEKRRD